MKCDSIIYSSYMYNKNRLEKRKNAKRFPLSGRVLRAVVYLAMWRTGCVMWIARD